MTRIYNRNQEKQTRRRLRRDAPKAERLLWSRLRGGRADDLKFRRQYSVGPYVLDFYCPNAKLAIEIDGESHFDAIAERKDAKRQSFIESFGIQFLRFTNPDVYDRLEDVVEEIRCTARERIALVRGTVEEANPPVSPLGKGGGAPAVLPLATERGREYQSAS